jgi:hypothetical protein
VVTKPTLWLLSAAIALLVVPAYLRTAQTAPVPVADAKQEDAVALRLMFGVQRIQPKTWDGEMTVDRGKILRLKGLYFEHEDAIVGSTGWKCTSRATVYTPSPGS